MRPLDKLIIIAIIAFSLGGLPGLVQSSFVLVIYGMSCVAAGFLMAIACEAYERSQKPLF